MTAPDKRAEYLRLAELDIGKLLELTIQVGLHDIADYGDEDK